MRLYELGRVQYPFSCILTSWLFTSFFGLVLTLYALAQNEQVPEPGIRRKLSLALKLLSSNCLDREYYRQEVEHFLSFASRVFDSTPIIMRLWTQIFGAFAASLNAASCGSAICYSAVLIYQLSKEDSELHMNLDEASWIPTILMVSSMTSSLLGGWFSGRFGRKPSIIIWESLALLCWFTTYFAPNKWVLFIARGVIGFAGGMYYSAINVYVSETVHKSLRNAIGTLPSTCLAFGMLYSFVCGYFFHWRTCALMGSVFPCLCIGFMLCCPESPYWLVEQGEDDKAKDALFFYRGGGFDFESEMQEILFVHKQKIASNRFKSSKSFIDSCKVIKDKRFLGPFSCVGVLFGLCQFGGIPSLIVYMPGIFEEAGSQLDSNLAAILVMSVRVITACLSFIVVHHVQKKHVFVCCSWIISMSMATLGFFNYLKASNLSEEFQATLDYLHWLPVGVTITAMVAHAMGVVNVLHILTAEIFPTEMRSFAVGVTQMSHNFVNVIAIKSYPWLLTFWGFSGTFLFYSSVAFCMGLWGLYKMEKNDGLSLAEIEWRLDNKKLKDVPDTGDC